MKIDAAKLKYKSDELIQIDANVANLSARLNEINGNLASDLQERLTRAKDGLRDLSSRVHMNAVFMKTASDLYSDGVRTIMEDLDKLAASLNVSGLINLKNMNIDVPNPSEVVKKITGYIENDIDTENLLKNTGIPLPSAGNIKGISTDFTEALLPGTTDGMVKEVQSALNEIVDTKLDIDGLYGTKTLEGVLDFFKKRGLYIVGASGVIGATAYLYITRFRKKTTDQSISADSDIIDYYGSRKTVQEYGAENLYEQTLLRQFGPPEFTIPSGNRFADTLPISWAGNWRNRK